MATFIVACIVFLIAALAVRSMWKNHKKGQCAGGCSGDCGGCNQCHTK